MNVRMPKLASTIQRRLLINYRVDPVVAQSLLPASLRPQLVDGSAVAGICLLRVGDLRPAWVRPQIGWGAENAAHRIAVEWDDASGTHSGVYIPERHSASWLAVAAGDRIFPGVHKHAHFGSTETDDRIEVAMASAQTNVRAHISVTEAWASTLFAAVADASQFFQNGAIGWSPTRNKGTLKGLKLETTHWRVQPGQALTVESSFFDALPAGSATLDSVLVMRNVPVTWSIPTEPGPSEVSHQSN